MTILRVPVLKLAAYLRRDRHTSFHETKRTDFPQQPSEKRFDKDFFGRGTATQQTRQFAPSKLPQGEVDNDERNGGICAPLTNRKSLLRSAYYFLPYDFSFSF